MSYNYKLLFDAVSVILYSPGFELSDEGIAVCHKDYFKVKTFELQKVQKMIFSEFALSD